VFDDQSEERSVRVRIHTGMWRGLRGCTDVRDFGRNKQERSEPSTSKQVPELEALRCYQLVVEVRFVVVGVLSSFLVQ
jgi:hypothetical protein